MTQAEWHHYVETGEVPLQILKEIASRIQGNQTLQIRDLAIYKTHSQLIEVLLKNPSSGAL